MKSPLLFLLVLVCAGAVAITIAHANTTTATAHVGDQTVTKTLNHKAPGTSTTLPSPGQDDDQNGLHDLWEIQHFGRTGIDPSADDDGDGLTNLQEFLSETDPLKPHPGWLFFALPANLIPVVASPGGIALLRDATHYWRWKDGTLTKLGEYWDKYMGNVSTTTSAVINRRGDVAIQVTTIEETADDHDTFVTETVVTTVYPIGGGPIWHYSAQPYLTVNDFLDGQVSDSEGNFVRWQHDNYTANALDSMRLAEDGALWGLRISGVESWESGPEAYDEHYQYFIYELVRVAPDETTTTKYADVAAFCGLDGTGRPVGTAYEPFPSTVTFGFVGEQVVPYLPSEQSFGGRVISFDSGNQSLYEPDGTVNHLPTNPYRYYFDFQERVNIWEYVPDLGGFRYSLITPTGVGGAWQKIPYTALPMPSGWSGNLQIAPGSEAAQLGTALINGVSQPFFAILNPAQLAVDANRDGEIHFSSEDMPVDKRDITSLDNPYRFWLNDDDDEAESFGSATDSERFPADQPDWENHLIDCQRDLEDFVRLQLYTGGLNEALKNGDLRLGLKWTGISGTPAIKIYKHLEVGGGTGYLTDGAMAHREYAERGLADTFPINDASGQHSDYLVDGLLTYVLPTSLFDHLTDNVSKSYFLIEGCKPGKGQLKVVILKPDGIEIGEGPGVWFDLVNIKSMYQRVKVTPREPSPITAPFLQSSLAFPERSTFDASTAGTEPSDDGYAFTAPSTEAQSALVFVHGSNIPYEEARWNAETMFKRLYWQGYQGRFVLFYWDTLIGPWDGMIPAHYNLNEYRAWKYGAALRNFVATNIPAGYARNVIGHSLGNGVVVSALRGYTSPTGTNVPSMTARNIIMLEAAMPASCFDSLAPTMPELTESESSQQTPDLAAQLGYRGVVATGVSGAIFNVYNENDFALGLWPLNQRLNKPESLSGYDRIYTWTAVSGGRLWLYGQWANDPFAEPLRPISDAHESMSFVARSRTAAVGTLNSTGSVSGNLNVGDGTELAFGRERSDHSGQFTRSVQQLVPLYRYIFERAR